MTQATFEPSAMTERELNLLKTLRTHLTINHETTFTVDTLRMLGFDRFLKKDTLGRINYGSLIGKWHYYGHVERTGNTVCSALESNHDRRIEVWKMKQ